MRLPRLLATPLAYRRLIRVLERQATAVEQANLLLARLVDRFVPPVDATATHPTEQAILSGTDRGDISHLDSYEMAVAEDFVAVYTTTKGHPPDEDEVFEYLADYSTRKFAETLNSSR